MMLTVSIFMGALGVGALLWGLKEGLFDDPEKFLGAAKFDSEEDLRDAAAMQKKKEEALKKQKMKKNYMPPD